VKLHRRPVAAVWLALCLLAGQWQGLAHRVEHGPDGGAVVQAELADHDHDHDRDHDHDHAPGSVECRLFDQALGHVDALWPATTLTLAVGSAPLPSALLATGRATAAPRAYRARGPPLRAGLIPA
jgi:hypothetical protein